MAIKSRNVLKQYFENGDKPNENQFWDLIDSLVHVNEGASSTSDGPTGTGVISDIITDENGNFVFTFVGGTTINISSVGTIGVVKMPIPYVDSYDNFYFVSEEKGNNTNALPNSYRFYKSIVAASEAARLNYDVTGKKNMVYVLKGTYKEESVNREHIDMYFEDGALVWTEGTDSSIINDKLEPIVNANVYGKGTFVNRQYDPYNDQEGINMRQASSMYVEAKLIDGIQLYNNDTIKFNLVNMDILFKISTWKNKTINIDNCRFLNGLEVSSFRNDGCIQEYNHCEFVTQEYTTTDPRNKTLDILDYNGDTLFRVEPDAYTRPEDQNPAFTPINVTGKTNDQVLAEFEAKYSNSRRGGYADIACIRHSQNEVYNGNDLRLEIRNSKCVIKRPSSFGVILTKHINSTPSEGQFILDNLVILDETESKDTTALVTGWGGAATQQPELLINSLSHNCGTRQKLLAKDFNEWKITFDTIGNFVPKTGGTFNGDVEVSTEFTTTELKVTDKLNLKTSAIIDESTLGANLNISSKWGSWLGLIDEYSNDNYVFHNPENGGRMEIFIQDGETKENKFGAFTLLKSGFVGIGTTNPATKLHINGGGLRIQTPTGYADMASQNASWFHFHTDRPNFYFNKGVRSNGDIGIYNKESYIRQSDGAIFENGVRIATQSWVNTAVAAAVATNVNTSDGIDSTAFARQESIPAATLKIGWYTIAVNAGNRASAKFVLKETKSGRHGNIHFYAAHNYGNGNVITVLSNSWYSGGGSIRYLRLKEAGTFEGVVLQAYIDTDDAPVSGLILEDIKSSGWTPKAWIPDAEDPGGLKDYSLLTNIAAQIDLDKTLGINSSAEIFVQGKKVHRIGADIDATDTEIRWIKNTDGASIGFKNTGDLDTDSYLYFRTSDNNNEYFKWIHDPSGTDVDVEWMQLKAGALKVLGNIESSGTYIKGANKELIRFADNWLRINPANEFTSGIYCGTKVLRTDGQFEVGPGGSKFKVDTNGNTKINGSFSVIGNSNIDGLLSLGTTNTRQSGVYGIYDSKKTGHIWSIGTAYKIDADGSGFGNLYGFGYKHTNNATGGTMASGHQAIWCQNGAPKVAIGNNIWTAGDVLANGTYYKGDDKNIIQFSDTWLRLNPSSHFTAGIYCGTKVLRTDGQFEVGPGGSKFKVDTNGNTTVFGNLSGKSVDKAYSHLYKFGGLHFTWDSDTYGTNAQHSIKSAYGTSMGDSLTMNSYNNIRLNIDSNNNNANSKFEIGHNTSGIANVVFSVDESGNAVAAGDLSAYSDRRLKEAIQPIKESFLDKIDQLKPSFYQWKDKAKEQTEQLGFIAQEVKEIFPQWVRQNNDHLSLSYDKMGAVLAVKGIQELHKEIKLLKQQLKELTNGITN